MWLSVFVLACQEPERVPQPPPATTESSPETPVPDTRLRVLGDVAEVDAFAILDGEAQAVATVRRARDLVPARRTLHTVSDGLLDLRFEEPLAPLRGTPAGDVVLAAADLEGDAGDDLVIGRIARVGPGRTATFEIYARPAEPSDRGADRVLRLPVDDRTDTLAFDGPFDFAGSALLVAPLAVGQRTTAWYRIRKGGESGPLLDDAPLLVGGGRTEAVAHGDIDGDARVDLVLANGEGSVSIHRGTALGFEVAPLRVVEGGDDRPGFGRAVALAGPHVLVAFGFAPDGPWQGAWDDGGQVSLCPGEGPVALASEGDRIILACGTATGVGLSSVTHADLVPLHELDAPRAAEIELQIRGRWLGVLVRPPGGAPGHLWIFELPR
jgi:hypothetical protein